VSQLVLRDFLSELPDGPVLELDLAPAFDIPRIRPKVRGFNALSNCGSQVILGFEVFEIQGEAENVLVVDLLG
jgi:hypothetical protein